MSSTMSSNSGVPEETKLNAGAEHSRHKRRRRGKKRKFHKCDRSLSVSDINENEADNQQLNAGENDAFEKDNVNRKRSRGVLIRPVNVPKAPKNSTQFIIDDHEGSVLYFSFETPNPYSKGEDPDSESHVEMCRTAAADDDDCQDMDYTYKSLQDWDVSAFYTQDFEAAYKSFRYDELVRLSKEDLLEAVHSVNSRLEELEEALVEYDPSPVLEQLQHKLLGLQEENAMLMEVNSGLKAMLNAESNESASEQSLEEELSGNEETVCTSGFERTLFDENIEIESASEPSDSNFSENEGMCGDLEPSGGPNDADSMAVESTSEYVGEPITSESEKTECTMSEKLSNVEISNSE